MKTTRFENALKNKLEVGLSGDFDSAFWTKFNSEFEEKISTSKSSVKAKRPWFLSKAFMAGISFAAFLVISVTVFKPFEELSPQSQMEVAMILEMEPALDNLDLFSQVDNLELTEDEWNVLVGDII
ncbi:MAG: hypothetical protein HOE90_10740 [Bacteriovoracaceae bacterium]|jgi:hypothetical protein|nr:hypothetical protein [Bacteriovoracaceae bacterium]